MTIFSRMQGRLLRAALLGATVSAFAVGDAAARVGVTSATDGDPLGKPPQEAERILRIGIDVQANELVTTQANDRAHLVFLDGSSLTVGPNARLTIDKFVFDPNTKTGELAINASKGVLRLVGGKISKNTPIVVTTPSSTVGIRGGITILNVQDNQTGSVFVFGSSMTVQSQGRTQTATRAGSQIITNLGSAPGAPTILAQGALSAQLSQLEGRSAPQGGGSGSGGGARNPDQIAQSSGLSGANSSQPVRVVVTAANDNFGSGPGPRNRNPNETIVTALSDVNQTQQTIQGLQQLQQALQQQASQQQQQQQQQVSQPQQPNFFEGLPPVPGVSPNQFAIAANSRFTTGAELNQLNMQNANATFSGPVKALINGNRMDGSYQNVWSFGQRQGVATVQINGSTYGGGAPNTFQQGSSPFFGSNGPIAATSGPTGRSANVIGWFLSKPGQAANQQVGVITLSGPGNQGAGFFVGSRPGGP
jgi:FecR protein